jgi:class 3 adenylate cyclase
MVDRSKSILNVVRSSLPHDTLERMNQFAEDIFLDTRTLPEDEITYLDEAFGLYMAGDTLPSQEEVERVLKNNTISGLHNFSYEKLHNAFAYWNQRFENQQDTLQIFRKMKMFLQQINAEEGKIGFPISDVYIVLEGTQKTTSGDNTLITVIDGSPWYESFMTGGIYTPPHHSGWETSLLHPSEGFSHNLVVDPNRFFLPQFYTDAYGEWFTVWYTRSSQGRSNYFSLDFDAVDVKKNMWITALTILTISFLVLLAITIVTARLSRRYSRSPQELMKGIHEISQGKYDYKIPVLYDEFSTVGKQFNRMTLKLQERDRLMSTLEKLLSKELAQKAAKQGLVLGGEHVACTLMFTDFAGFSSITQHMEPQETVAILNEYFEALIQIIVRNGGFPDKYIGDAIVAIFGAPVRFEDHAEKAVQCAIEMQRILEQINTKRRKERKVVFEMRIGLNTGKVLVGAIGSDLKLEYTSIGETTNLAQRMESNARIGHIMVTGQTYSQLRKKFLEQHHVQAVARDMTIKGYHQVVKTYDILVSDREILKNENLRDARKIYIYQKMS